MNNYVNVRFEIESWEENIPHGDEAIAASREHLSVVGAESDADDGTGVGTAFMDKLAAAKVVNAQHSHSSTNGKVFVVVGDSYSVELFRFTFVRTTIQNCFCVYFSQVPVCNSTLLSNSEELVIVKGTDSEAIQTTHSLLLCTYTFFCLQVPAED